MHIFTYGTLMFPEVWQAVVSRPFASVGGHVTGYAVYRVRDAVYPGMLATTTTDAAEGVVYIDADAAVIERLDQFEDDFYRRETVAVRCDDGRICDAETYVVPPEHRGVLTDELWKKEAFLERGDLQHFLARFPGFRRLMLGD